MSPSAPEEVAGVGLRERPEALVGVPFLNASRSSDRGGFEGPAGRLRRAHPRPEHRLPTSARSASPAKERSFGSKRLARRASPRMSSEGPAPGRSLIRKSPR